MKAVYLTRTDPGRNVARFYAMSLQETLFGECSLVREWGRIGRAGQTRIDNFPAEQEAMKAMETLNAAKTRKGYSIKAS